MIVVFVLNDDHFLFIYDNKEKHKSVDMNTLTDNLEITRNAIATYNTTNSIAHYTSIDVLKNIASGVYHNQGEYFINLRATDGSQTNDRGELMLGHDYLMETLYQLESINGYNEDKYRLSTYQENIKCLEKYKQYSDEEIGSSLSKLFFGGIRKPYIICFTTRIDDLNIWNSSYGNNGKGICLIFNFEKMKFDNPRILVNEPLRVVYGNDPGYLEERTILFKAIDTVYCEYVRTVETMSDEDAILQLKIAQIEVLCSFVSSYFKTEDWREESEVRIVCMLKHEMFNSEICYCEKTRKGYLNIPIPLSILKQIYIGPCVKTPQIKEIKECAKVLKVAPENVIISNKPLRC